MQNRYCMWPTKHKIFPIWPYPQIRAVSPLRPVNNMVRWGYHPCSQSKEPPQTTAENLPAPTACPTWGEMGAGPGPNDIGRTLLTRSSAALKLLMPVKFL